MPYWFLNKKKSGVSATLLSLFVILTIVEKGFGIPPSFVDQEGKVNLSERGEIINVNRASKKGELKSASDGISYLRLKRPGDPYGPSEWSSERPDFYSNDYGFGMGMYYIGGVKKKIYLWNVYCPILGTETQTPTGKMKLFCWFKYVFEPTEKCWYFTSSMGNYEIYPGEFKWLGWIYINPDYSKEVPWGTWNVTIDYEMGDTKQRILDMSFEMKEFIGNRKAEPEWAPFPFRGHFNPYNLSSNFGTIKYTLPPLEGRLASITIKIFDPPINNLVRVLVGKKKGDKIEPELRKGGENEEIWSGIVEDKDYVGLIGVSSREYYLKEGTKRWWYNCLIEAKDPWDDYPKGSEKYKKSINPQSRWVMFWLY